MLKLEQVKAELILVVWPGFRLPPDGEGVFMKAGFEAMFQESELPPVLVMAMGMKESGQGLPPTVWVLTRVAGPANSSTPGSGGGGGGGTMTLMAKNTSWLPTP